MDVWTYVTWRRPIVNVDGLLRAVLVLLSPLHTLIIKVDRVTLDANVHLQSLLCADEFYSLAQINRSVSVLGLDERDTKRA